MEENSDRRVFVGICGIPALLKLVWDPAMQCFMCRPSDDVTLKYLANAGNEEEAYATYSFDELTFRTTSGYVVVWPRGRWAAFYDESAAKEWLLRYASKPIDKPHSEP